MHGDGDYPILSLGINIYNSRWCRIPSVNVSAEEAAEVLSADLTSGRMLPTVCLILYFYEDKVS